MHQVSLKIFDKTSKIESDSHFNLSIYFHVFRKLKKRHSFENFSFYVEALILLLRRGGGDFLYGLKKKINAAESENLISENFA